MYGSSAAMVSIPKNTDSLTYNHCVILFFQAFFHIELLANLLQAYQVQHMKKSITTLVTQSGQIKYQNQVRPVALFFSFPIFDPEHRKYEKQNVICFLVSDSETK